MGLGLLAGLSWLARQENNMYVQFEGEESLYNSHPINSMDTMSNIIDRAS